MNGEGTLPTIVIRPDEVMALVETSLENDDMERAYLWMALLLSSNDPKQPADA
jgi:hypothetical protein